MYIKNKKISESDIQLLENEYVTGSATYAALAEAHSLPLSFIQRCGRLNNWKQKRKAFRAAKANMPECDRVERTDKELSALLEACGLAGLFETSLKLDGIVSRAVKCADISFAEQVDTKALKELAATVKEAVGIKRNLLLTPVLTEQRLLELNNRKNASAQDGDKAEAQVIRVMFDGGLEEFCG